jgi:hypothetical protein
MTTLDPGASEVFTHGLAESPRSTALRASRAAPIITCGLDVLVHEVIDAMTTAPWSSSNEVPSGSTHGVGLCTRMLLAREFEAGGSDAGKLSSTSSSTPSSAT